MFDENFLLDSFSMTGNSLSKFEAVLDEMLRCTIFEKKSSRDVQLLSYVEDDDKNIVFYKLNPDNLHSGSTTYPIAMPRVSLSKAKVLKRGNFEKILEEVKETKLAIHDTTKTYFVSKNVFATMDAFGLKGSFLETPCLERDIMVAKQFSYGRNCTLVTKTFGDARKVFAVLSDKYTTVPQSVLVDIVNNIEKKNILGKVVCRHWEVNHFASLLYVEFPEKAEELKKFYGLSADFVPGLFLATSDTGDCSLTIRGTWRIGNSYSLHKEVKRKHTGKIDIEKIISDIDKTIFAEYAKLPETLCDLMSFDITDPSWDLSTTKGQRRNEKAVADTLMSVFQQIALVKAIGKKTEKSLREQLCSEFDYSLPYTAYDLCFAIMNMPARTSGLNATCQQAFEKAVGNTPYANYSPSTAVLI